MALWLIRAGRYGEQESYALEQGVAVIGWELPDLSGIKSRKDLASLLAKTYRGTKSKARSNWESQIWPFIDTIQVKDLVALPLKGRATVAVGEVAGPYKYQGDQPVGAQHTRPVKWLKEIARTSFEPDLLFSLGAFMTVCRIQRNQAEERVRALLAGQGKDGLHSSSETDEDALAENAPPDLEQFALNQIRDLIGRRYKGHALTALVGAILEAQGYRIRISPEGADGGVDIIAGQGVLGFDPPRLAVQVKSGDAPGDVMVLRALQGVMKNFQAEHGLIVSLSGFKSSVPKEAARLFFSIRLWDASDLVGMLLAHYEKLSEEFQAALPLKRIWTLVPEEE